MARQSSFQSPSVTKIYSKQLTLLSLLIEQRGRRDRNSRSCKGIATFLRPASGKPFVVAGFANKVIAADLGTSEITIGVHRGQIMRKMGAKSLAELVRMADKLGITRITDPV